eukprot:3442155-Pleurochrysis_carterae.AAC.1
MRLEETYNLGPSENSYRNAVIGVKMAPQKHDHGIPCITREYYRAINRSIRVKDAPRGNLQLWS